MSGVKGKSVGGLTGKALRERDEANYQYFMSLGESRASLTGLPMMGLLTAILLAVDLAPLGPMVFHHGFGGLLPLFYGHLVFIGFGLLVFVVSLFQGWVYRYQVFTSGLMVLFTIVGWVYAACFMAICMATVDVGFGGVAEFSATRLYIAGVFCPLFVVGALVVHVFLLRKRLRVGHSRKRMMGNYLAASSVYRSKSLWIIFAVALIGPNLLTGGRYILVTLGTLMFLLFACASTSLPVEFGYLTWLKARDKKYWERRPPKIVTTREQKTRAWKKVGKWTLIILAAIVVVGVLNEVLPMIF